MGKDSLAARGLHSRRNTGEERRAKHNDVEGGKREGKKTSIETVIRK